MLLGRAHRVELEAVLRVDLVGGRRVVGPGVRPGRERTVGLEEPVARLPDDVPGEGEAVVLAGVEGEGLLQEVGRSELLLVRDAGRHRRGIGDDVHRPADGRRRQVHRGQAALHLDAGGRVAEAVPVGPVDPAVLHVVDRHAVDHHGGVALVEAADVHPGVARAAALHGGVHARRHVQDHGKVLRAQLLLDLHLRDVGVGHGRLPLDRPRGEHLQGVDGDGFLAESEVDGAGLPGGQHHVVHGLQAVADHARLDAVRTARAQASDRETTVGLAQGAILGSRALVHHHDLDARQRRTVLVRHAPGEGRGGLGSEVSRQRQCRGDSQPPHTVAESHESSSKTGFGGNRSAAGARGRGENCNEVWEDSTQTSGDGFVTPAKPVGDFPTGFDRAREVVVLQGIRPRSRHPRSGRKNRCLNNTSLPRGSATFRPSPELAGTAGRTRSGALQPTYRFHRPRRAGRTPAVAAGAPSRAGRGAATSRPRAP